MPSPVRQLINGLCYDFSSIEITILGVIFHEITSIDYEHNLAPQVLRGTSAKKLGRSRGQYEASGTLTFGEAAWAEFLALVKLANPLQGFMETAFPITVTYGETGSPLIVDVLQGARITSSSVSHAAGSDVLVHQAAIDIMNISENGISAVGVLGL